MIATLLRGVSNTCFVIGGVFVLVAVQVMSAGIPADLTPADAKASLAWGATLGYTVGVFLPAVVLLLAGWGLRVLVRKQSGAAPTA